VVGAGGSRSIAAGSWLRIAARLAFPDRPVQWHFEVCSPVTVAGPRRIRTGFPSATGDTVTN